MLEHTRFDQFVLLGMVDGLKAGNGEIVAEGEAYDTMAAAQEGCAAVQRAANGADVVEADS